MSYAGLGQVIPSATVGRDPSRRVAGAAVRVGARWAQRAANAGNRYNNSSAALIAVDGRAGPITISALRALSHQFASDQPVTNDPATSRVTDAVIMPLALETALAARAFVPDPPPSAATRQSAPTTTGASAVTVPIPGAPPAPSPADEIILDEGSSGGLIARYGIAPFAIGGAVLVGVGLWFLSGGGRLRANRRRRVRRNNPFTSSAGRRVWILAVGDRGDFMKSYDWNPGIGVADYAVTKSQREAMKLTSDEAKFVAKAIGEYGTSVRVVQPGELKRNGTRSLHAIAAEIVRDWKKPYYGAVPYLQAMASMNSISDDYGADTGEYIVVYFLGNASGWRGPVAKRVKAELNEMLKAHKAHKRVRSNGRRGLWDLSLRGRGMSHRLGLPMSKTLAKQKARHFRSQGYKVLIVRARAA